MAFAAEILDVPSLPPFALAARGVPLRALAARASAGTNRQTLADAWEAVVQQVAPEADLAARADMRRVNLLLATRTP